MEVRYIVMLQCFCSVSVVFLNNKKHVTNEVELTYMCLLTYMVPTYGHTCMMHVCMYVRTILEVGR